jgi:predicted DNA-binding ArsR family transcriptional regulator
MFLFSQKTRKSLLFLFEIALIEQKITYEDDKKPSMRSYYYTLKIAFQSSLRDGCILDL